jgi:Domain of unknown function (DUF4189)
MAVNFANSEACLADQRHWSTDAGVPVQIQLLLTWPRSANLYIMKFAHIVVFMLLAASSSYAQAQCKIGSGPDNGDGVPYCHEEPAPPAKQGQWYNFAAVLVVGYNDEDPEFVGIEKYPDVELAIEVALKRCEAKGWQDCKMVKAVKNGVIAVARRSDKGLHHSWHETKKEAKKALLKDCKDQGVTCKVIATFDGRARFLYEN